MRRQVICALGLLLLAGNHKAIAANKPGGQRVCTLYSTIILAPDEKAEVHGAGQGSVSLLIKGRSGEWIFYDGLGDGTNPLADDTLFLKSAKSNAYRRSHDKRVYSILPSPPKLVGGKPVISAASGLDFMKRPLSNPALKGTDADKALLKRILPGQKDACDLRWQPGKGLVP